MQNNNRRMDAIATACFVFEDGCTFFIKNGDENMGNLMTSFNAGVSGLHSAQQSLTVTSHNLANAGTCRLYKTTGSCDGFLLSEIVRST